MKRAGFLFDRATSFGALVEAAGAAARGKRAKVRPSRFLMDLEHEAISLEKELKEGGYRPRPYRTFPVHDPKERMICAADFRDRVVHHAVCRELDPVFEKTYIRDSYACRKGGGTHAAARRAQFFCRRFTHFLKLDVRKFFDTIDHGVLKAMLRRKLKDPDLLSLLDTIIDHPVPWTSPGKGIPIGNLTSQHFANFYLSSLDHFIKEDLRVSGYVRYMDDLVLFADEKGTLWDAFGRVERFLNRELLLDVKPGSALLAPVTQGLPFLGLRVFPAVVRINRKGWRRFRRKALNRERRFNEGLLGDEELERYMASLTGHLRQADARNLRAAFFERRVLNFTARGKRGSNRVKRGGSWNNDAQNCRSANRNNNDPGNRNNNLGFRLASSRFRPDAARPRTRRPSQTLTLAPDRFRRSPDEQKKAGGCQ